MAVADGVGPEQELTAADELTPAADVAEPASAEMARDDTLPVLPDTASQDMPGNCTQAMTLDE